MGRPGSGSGNVKIVGGVQGSTISLQAVVHLRRMPRALMKEEEEEEEEEA